jgi:hypothetical protein
MDWALLNGCQDDGSGCKGAAADASGNFTISYAGSYDILRGDYVHFDAFDSGGNAEYGSWTSNPALVANLSQNTITGLWVKPDTDLTISVQKKDGQHEDISARSDEYLGMFYGYPATLLAPGDLITVTDGARTESMTVGTLSGSFNSVSKHLTGVAPNARLVADMSDFDRDNSMTHRCQATMVSGGAFDLDFSAASIVGPQDHAYLSSTGPDDQSYTLLEVNVAGIDVFFGNDFYGYTPAPGDSFTLEVQQADGTVITTSPTMTSMPTGGQFWWSIPDPLFAGQQVLQKNSAGEVVARVSMPALTITLDPISQRVYGQGPKNDPINIELYQETWDGSDWLQVLPAAIDSSGNYSLIYGELPLGCFEDACLYSALNYYDEKENRIMIASAPPAPVSKDSFEPDDSIETATPFVPGDVHTFDSSADVDWVSLSYDGDQVGKPYTLKTMDAGPAARVTFTVYGPDKTTVIASENLQVGDVTRISFTPTDPGKYYLKMAPESAEAAGKCGSYYAVGFNYDLIVQLIFND